MKKKINQMTFQQAHELAFMLMDDNGELPVKDRVTKSEIGISSKPKQKKQHRYFLRLPLFRRQNHGKE